MTSDVPGPSANHAKLWYLAEDAMVEEGWRERLSWPVTPTRLRELGEDVCLEALTAAGEVRDPMERQVLLVGLGLVVNSFMVLAELAYVATDSQVDYAEVISPPPEYDAFSGDGCVVNVAEDSYRNKGVQDLKAANLPVMRSLIRTHNWSGLAGLPAAALGRDGWVISHNHLLIGYLRKNQIRASFRHAANIVAVCRKHGGEDTLDDERISAFLTGVIERMVDLTSDLPAEMRRRFASVLWHRLMPTFRTIAADVAAIRAHRGLPDTIWSGTNGSYATRLVVSEVRRRGGQVNVFDHGGVSGISQILPLTGIVEGLFSTTFYVGTQQWSELLLTSGLLDIVQGLNAPRITHCDGEPTFRHACIDDTQIAPRRRVIYISHPYYGHRQFAIAGMRDPIYMDFQIDLIERLKSYDIDLMIKPHPEGHFGGDTYPLQHMAPTSFRRFEEHLRDADLFIFDAPTSTTFCEALCTRRPVILIERTQYPVNPKLDQNMAERCRIVKTHYIDGNRLRVDAAGLEAAILNSASEADPSFFRALLAGDEISSVAQG